MSQAFNLLILEDSVTSANRALSERPGLVPKQDGAGKLVAEIRHALIA